MGQQLLGRAEEITGRGAVLGVVEDLRILAFQFPGGEEESPIDEARQLVERLPLDHAPADEGWLGNVLGTPHDGRLAGIGRGIGHQRASLFVGVNLAQLLLLGAGFLGESVPLRGIQQRGNHAHRARGIEHMQGGTAALGRNLDCRVFAIGSGAADEQGLGKAPAFHFLRHVHHLVERGCDQPG